MSIEMDDTNRIIRQGETYTHEIHGEVKVQGIWKGVTQVDEARQSDEQDVYVVRFSVDTGGMRTENEFTNTLGKFLRLTE